MYVKALHGERIAGLASRSSRAVRKQKTMGRAPGWHSTTGKSTTSREKVSTKLCSTVVLLLLASTRTILCDVGTLPGLALGERLAKA
jgi:hypothetical protein